MADYLDCTKKDLTMEQLMSSLLTKNADGEVAVRIMFTDACAENAIDCNKGGLPLNSNLSKAIGVNDCGKAALRLGVTVEALATHLGLAFASNAEAKTSLGNAGFTYYDTTLNAWAITT